MIVETARRHVRAETIVSIGKLVEEMKFTRADKIKGALLDVLI